MYSGDGGGGGGGEREVVLWRAGQEEEEGRIELGFRKVGWGFHHYVFRHEAKRKSVFLNVITVP